MRVLKVALPTGEVETLITSLNQKQLPISKAGELYFERWKVETAFDLLKSKLELENFSGKTKASVLQDFYATIYMANIISFAAEEADALIADVAKYPIPVVPGRSPLRKTPRNKRFFQSRRSVV